MVAVALLVHTQVNLVDQAVAVVTHQDTVQQLETEMVIEVEITKTILVQVAEVLLTLVQIFTEITHQDTVVEEKIMTLLE